MQKTIVRKELLKATLAAHNVTDVDIREIRFEPGQQTGRHFHPCTVVGYIAEGMAVMQVEGQEPIHLPAGAAFHEPVNTMIARFDNASDTEPMTFIAIYLLNGQQDLIQMLE